jgi:acetyltransferase-like isoleucine patch superfamily enzyme
MCKHAYRSPGEVTLPAPRVFVLPARWVFVALRSAYYFISRVFVCEPIFKSYCKEYGRSVRTGVYIHWISGSGDLILGDHVLVDGKCSITFAARFSDHPTLKIGSRTEIGHATSITVGKSVVIGRHCHIAGGVLIFDSNAHPADPTLRLVGLPPGDVEVRPITVEDNVWIGARAIVHPGVTIGEGSVVSAGSVVMADVPPFTIVAGNPARRIVSLQPTGDTVAPR